MFNVYYDIVAFKVLLKKKIRKQVIMCFRIKILVCSINSMTMKYEGHTYPHALHVGVRGHTYMDTFDLASFERLWNSDHQGSVNISFNSCNIFICLSVFAT